MTSRRRNLAILAAVAGLLVLAALLVIPGSPLEKKTRLGLDLKGGVELIYEGRPTPQVPEVTPQAIDDSIETIRKRTDALLPDPILVGRNEGKLRALAEAHGVRRVSTDLDACLADPGDQIYFDATSEKGDVQHWVE